MLAAALDRLVPAAQYFGSLTGPQTKTTYQSIEWLDDRPQPTWAELQAALPDILVEARNTARRMIIAYADRITARITDAYPAAEVASWPTREIEARAVAEGEALPDGSLIAALAAAANQTPQIYAARVLAKAAGYRQVVVAVTVIREAAQAAISAARSAGEIDAALAAIKTQADAKAAEMGLAP
jgi:hypothetical protein